LRTASLIALPVDRRLLGELVQPGKSDVVSSPELLGGPRELIRLQDTGQRSNPVRGPRDTNDRSLVTVFVEVRPVHLEKRADPLKAPLDRTIEIAHRDIDQARGELGETSIRLPVSLKSAWTQVGPAWTKVQ
jgi:hypothetical protein